MEHLKEATQRLATASNDEQTLQILNDLDNEESVKKLHGLTNDDLKASGLGKELAKLMKSSNSNIATKSKAVVEKCKQAIKSSAPSSESAAKDKDKQAKEVKREKSSTPEPPKKAKSSSDKKESKEDTEDMPSLKAVVKGNHFSLESI